MHGDAHERLFVSEQIVDADGPASLERISGRLDVQGLLQALERRDQSVDQLRFDRILDDRIAVPFYPARMLRESLRVEHASGSSRRNHFFSCIS